MIGQEYSDFNGFDLNSVPDHLSNFPPYALLPASYFEKYAEPMAPGPGQPILVGSGNSGKIVSYGNIGATVPSVNTGKNVPTGNTEFEDYSVDTALPSPCLMAPRNHPAAISSKIRRNYR